MARGEVERVAVDWQSVERSPEFRRLVRRRNRFLVPITVAWVAFFGAYVLLAAFAPDIMDEETVAGLTLGFVLSVAQVLMTWVVTLVYLRRCDREFDGLEARAREVAARASRGEAQ